MRYYQHAKVLSVGLSRLLRANAEIRAMIPELSIVSPDTGGLPVAYGILRGALRTSGLLGRPPQRRERGHALPSVSGAEAGAKKCCWWTTYCGRAATWGS